MRLFSRFLLVLSIATIDTNLNATTLATNQVYFGDRFATGLFVLKLDEGNTVQKIDIPGIDSVHALRVTPDGTKIYIARNYLSTSTSVVHVVDLGRKTVLQTISNPKFVEISDIAFSQDGSKAYVLDKKHSNSNDGAIHIINVSAGNSVIPNVIQGFSEPVAIALTPDSSQAYVLNTNHRKSVSIVNLQNKTISKSNVGSFGDPSGLDITPSGKFAYIADFDKVRVMDLSNNNTFLAPISFQGAGVTNGALAIKADGTRAFFSTQQGIVSIDLSNNTANPTPIAPSSNLTGISPTPIHHPENQQHSIVRNAATSHSPIKM